MRPDMQNYVDAGGKVITASIMHKPWNGQTYDPFESMVTWLKKADGTWYFDYTVFDKWVEYMMSLGVKKQNQLLFNGALETFFPIFRPGKQFIQIPGCQTGRSCL